MFRQDVNNVSPRAGLAYQFAPGWVLRAGYGIFFDRYVLANLNRAVQKDGPTAFEQVVYGDAAATAFQTAGGSLLAPIGGLRPSIYRADAGLGTPYSQQTSFSMEHLVARDLTASASYLFVRGVKLPRTRNINLVMPGPAFGPSRAYPRFDNIYQLENSASSTYQGVSFSVNRRMSSELEFSASYTLSKTFDDASDFDEQPQNPFNLKDERALSLQRQQQRLVFSSLWELPIGDEEAGKPAEDNWITRVFGHIEVAPIFTVESGRPVNPLTGVDSTRSGAFPLSSRPGLRTQFAEEPNAREYGFPGSEIPFGKTARLDLVGEAFNLFNRANVTRINPVYGVGGCRNLDSCSPSRAPARGRFSSHWISSSSAKAIPSANLEIRKNRDLHIWTLKPLICAMRREPCGSRTRMRQKNSVRYCDMTPYSFAIVSEWLVGQDADHLPFSLQSSPLYAAMRLAAAQQG
jgi:hypothetical protein